MSEIGLASPGNAVGRLRREVAVGPFGGHTVNGVPGMLEGWSGESLLALARA